MEIKEESAYGMIPLYRERGEVKVFLINQYGSAGDIFWGLPKGHQEDEETPLETAKREVFEETGLTPEVSSEEKMYEVRYEFDLDGVHIKKLAGYFVGWVDNPAFKVQEEEVKEAGWFTFEEALTRCTFERYSDLLKAVRADFKL